MHILAHSEDVPQEANRNGAGKSVCGPGLGYLIKSYEIHGQSTRI